MSKQPLSISDEAKVQMPMRDRGQPQFWRLVAVSCTWAFFGVIQRKIKYTRN